MQQGRILAASHDGSYVIRLVGDVRLTLCSTIDDYFQHMYEDPNFASVWVDLCEAEGIDSTTLGLLAKLALKIKDKFGFEPAIYSCDPGINRLLKSMAFHRLFDLHEEACSNPENIAEIPTVQGSEESVKNKVIEAHRVLMDISEDNRERFKDLVTALERG
jgi:anti-anti-sigma regulatory factor